MANKFDEACFDYAEWQKALEGGALKGINKSTLANIASPNYLKAFYIRLKKDAYDIMPPREILIPKDDGTMRHVWCNENEDRVFLTVVNNVLFKMCPELIHPNSLAYQSGIGTGKIVQKVSGWFGDKYRVTVSDYSKYFDTVPLYYIDKAFDYVETKFGKSCVIDCVRRYYHNNLCLCLDDDGNYYVDERYLSLKQGCAVASWLANVVMYELDDKLNMFAKGKYVRYSDDSLIIHWNSDKVYRIMDDHVRNMGMSLNPNKVRVAREYEWIKFLGFSLRQNDISLSKNRIKTFKNEIANRTIKKRNASYESALNSVLSYLYKGNGEYSWASQVLPIVNNMHDIQRMNNYTMDCLRAVKTGHSKGMYGLGYDKFGIDGVIPFSTGRCVGNNRRKVGDLDGYVSLMTYKLAPREARETLVRMM